MNTFLLAFLGSLFALLVTIISVYTYASLKIKPVFERFKPMLDTAGEASGRAIAGLVNKDAINEAIQRGDRVVVLPDATDLAIATGLANDRLTDADRAHLEYLARERQIVEIMNGRPPDRLPQCPLCSARIEHEPSATPAAPEAPRVVQ